MISTASYRSVTRGIVVAAVLSLPYGTAAQDRHEGRYEDRAGIIDAGTVIDVRTTERIDVRTGRDGRVFRGVVDDDVWDVEGRVVIPRGSSVELIVRTARDNDLILDLDSVTAGGVRYAISANTNRVESPEGIGNNSRTGQYVGGGALLGSIVGAIAGGRKGAAIGAIAGATAGGSAQMMTRGQVVRVPAESVVSFELNEPLAIGIVDRGSFRRGRHFHEFNSR